jgi:hypothetical protein
MNVTLGAVIVPPSVAGKRLGFAYFRAQFDIGLTDTASLNVGIEPNKVGVVTGLLKLIPVRRRRVCLPAPQLFGGSLWKRPEDIASSGNLHARSNPPVH